MRIIFVVVLLFRDLFFIHALLSKAESGETPLNRKLLGVCFALLEESQLKEILIIKPDNLNLGNAFNSVQRSYATTMKTFSSLEPQEEERISTCKTVRHAKSHSLLLILFPTRHVLVNIFYDKLSVPSTTFVLYTNQSSDLESVIRKAWQFKYLHRILLVNASARAKYYDPFTRCESGGAFRKISTSDSRRVADRLTGHVKSLAGCKLSISMYQREQTAALLPNKRFSGQDGKLIELLAEKMNFTPVINLLEGRMTYGYKIQNGSYVGTFANLIYGTSDVSLNGHFLKDYYCDVVELTRQITSDRVCIMAPKAGAIPPIFAVLKSFQPEVWTMITIAYLLACVAFYLRAEYSSRFMNDVGGRRGCILELDLFRIMIAAPSNTRFGKFSEKVLFAFCWFFSTVILNSFQGSLVTFLNKPMHYQDVDSFQDLIESELPIRTASISFRELLLSDPNLSKLEKRIYFSRNESIVENFKGHFAGFQRINVYNLKYFKDIKYKPNKREPSRLLHTMKECLTSYFIAYAIPKDSPYKKRIDEIIAGVDYGGFIIKWNSDTANFIFQKYRLYAKAETKIKVFSLRDLEAAFFVFIIGMSFSSVVYVGENLWYYTRKRRKF